MVIRPDADEHFGGDRVQMIETAKALRNLDVKVVERVGPAERADYEGVDIVHLFNLLTPEFNLREIDKAKSAGKRIAIFTIWWEQSAEHILVTSRKWKLARNLIGKANALKLLEPRVEAVREPGRAPLRRILEQCDVIIANSEMEAKQILVLGDYPNVHPVHLGIDIDRFDPNRPLDRPRWLPDADYVLCSGRIEDFKGQLPLTKACTALGIPCVLMGAQTDPRVAEECRSLGAILVGPKWGDDVVSAYMYARVHAQPSRYEVPGLSNLEAAAMGCPVIASKHGSTREYLGEWAEYVDPFSVKSIEQAVGKSLGKARSIEQSGFIRRNFNWSAVASATRDHYIALDRT